MFKRAQDYFCERRRALATAAGVAGGLYLLGHYVIERLEEARDNLMQDRIARDNLRRRFQKNQQDISFQVMALLPTLGNQILSEMNVEEVTKELQTKSKAARRKLGSVSLDSSIASSADLSQDSRSDAGNSTSVLSLSGHEGFGVSSIPTDSSQSWVEEFSAQTRPSRDPSPGAAGPRTDSISPESHNAAYLSDSIATTDSLASSSNGEPAHSLHPEGRGSESSGSSTKSKSELWNEVKILAFTRTLTVLYSTTLLTLLTHIQLNLLGRSKYVESIIQLERDEKLRERLEFGATVSSLFWGGADDGNLDSDIAEALLEGRESMSEETERKYLTLSWWLLNLGWKDVGERVRRAVEETVESLSLKTKLDGMELHRLIRDIRRRVEYEFTFERQERRVNFLTAMLPSTSETLQHVLTQGGVSLDTLAAGAPDDDYDKNDPTFASLLSETRSLITSSDFSRVLEVCLDKGTDVLFDGLRRNVFVDESGQASEEVKLRLAGLLPGLVNWSHLALNGLPNELIDGICDVREVAAFSAIIYSNFEGQLQR